MTTTKRIVLGLGLLLGLGCDVPPEADELATRDEALSNETRLVRRYIDKDNKVKFFYTSRDEEPPRGNLIPYGIAFKLWEKGGPSRLPVRRCAKVGDETFTGPGGRGIDAILSDPRTYAYKDGDTIVTVWPCPAGWRGEGVMGFVSDHDEGPRTLPLWEATNSVTSSQFLDTERTQMNAVMRGDLLQWQSMPFLEVRFHGRPVPFAWVPR
jgi:hypothetical protein